ncbi:MAG: two component transcriptional regulator, LuxR family [Gemmatimonadetes bacterium]|nr:two component transcriptional regulator, LuxR family [Gemmatimonadota bacterium]
MTSSSSPGARIRVAVVDDHPVVREGLVLILQTQPDFEIVGEGETGGDAIDVVERLAPDVLILDLELPGLDGVAVLRRLRERGATTRTIAFTVFDTDDRIIGAVEAGAAGYLLKGAPSAELFAAIRIVHGGGSLLQPLVASTVMRHMAAHGRQSATHTVGLTEREREVLQRLARAMSNKEIAAALGVTERTVKFHVASLFTKLGAGNRTEAVTRAVQAGLVTL